MGQALSSRERVLLAYARREPDRVPIVFRTIEPLAHRWRNQVERAEFLLSWGADDLLTFALPLVTHRSAIRRVWREESRPCWVPLQLPRCLAQDSPLLQVYTVDILEQPYVL
jgi:hypothetical protein